jgi:hypothetical protein
MNIRPMMAAAGKWMNATTRHMSTRKFPTVFSPRKARMIAVGPQNQIDAERNMFGNMKKIWLKLERAWSPV